MENGRVDGILAVSRAIGESVYLNATGLYLIIPLINYFLILSGIRVTGDLELRNVIPNPEVIKVELTGKEEYLVLATDGLWDEVTALHCSEVVREYLLKYRNLILINIHELLV